MLSLPNLLKRAPRVLVLASLLALPSTASATVYTPNPSDLGDLDHYNLYSWRIQDAGLAGQNVQSATLTFTKLFNWDSNPNKLYMWLFNDAYTAGASSNGGAVLGTPGNTCVSTPGNCVTQFTDTASTSQLSDGFLASNGKWTQAGWLIPSGTEGLKMTDRDFAAHGAAPTTNPTGWTSQANGSVWYNGSSKTAYNYTYTFQADELAALNAYIDAGNSFALGFDPDCHYYNSGVSLTLNTVPQVVPEPASLLLLGVGLVFAARRARKA